MANLSSSNPLNALFSLFTLAIPFQSNLRSCSHERIQFIRPKRKGRGLDVSCDLPTPGTPNSASRSSGACPEVCKYAEPRDFRRLAENSASSSALILSESTAPKADDNLDALSTLAGRRA